MKKLLALLVFSLAFTPLVVRAQDWQYTADSDGVISLIDVDSIKMSNGKVYFWNLYEYTPHMPCCPDTLSSKTFTSIIDCDLLSYQNIRRVFFSEEFGYGEVVSRHEEKEPVRYAIPGSVMGDTVKWVCDHIENKM